jgi:hypothetical protein
MLIGPLHDLPCFEKAGGVMTILECLFRLPHLPILVATYTWVLKMTLSVCQVSKMRLRHLQPLRVVWRSNHGLNCLTSVPIRTVRTLNKSSTSCFPLFLSFSLYSSFVLVFLCHILLRSYNAINAASTSLSSVDYWNVCVKFNAEMNCYLYFLCFVKHIFIGLTVYQEMAGLCSVLYDVLQLTAFLKRMRSRRPRPERSLRSPKKPEN